MALGLVQVGDSGVWLGAVVAVGLQSIAAL